MADTEQDFVSLAADAQAKEAIAEQLHAAAAKTPPGSPEWVAADEAEGDANEEWEAASAVASKIEGFTGGEAAE